MRAAAITALTHHFLILTLFFLVCSTCCCCLQPLAVDWREKLKTTRKGSKKGSTSSSPDPSSSAAQPQPAQSASEPAQAADLAMTADGKPNLELLSKGLPAGWRAMWDKNTGDIYYGNLKSRVRFCLTQMRRTRNQNANAAVAAASVMAENFFFFLPVYPYSLPSSVQSSCIMLHGVA